MCRFLCVTTQLNALDSTWMKTYAVEKMPRVDLEWTHGHSHMIWCTTWTQTEQKHTLKNTSQNYYHFSLNLIQFQCLVLFVTKTLKWGVHTNVFFYLDSTFFCVQGQEKKLNFWYSSHLNVVNNQQIVYKKKSVHVYCKQIWYNIWNSLAGVKIIQHHK